jgi:uncharacterized protein YjeT (DUF2065 family)
MGRTWVAVAAVLVVVGLVWIGQGLGYLGGSFMTDDPTWAVIGMVTVVAGLVLGYLGKSR